MKIKRKLKIFFPIIFAFSVFLPKVVLAAYTYKMMEKIPGFENDSTELPSLILSIYKFGLWTIGIAAMFMITLGGFMYITSAGNSSSAGKAKKFITDALAGLILAFVAFLILYIINPDLVKIQLNNFGLSGDSGGHLANNTVGGGRVNTNISKMCPDPNSTTPIDFTKSMEDSSIQLSSTCDRYNFSNNQGVDPCVLKAMAQMESSCGVNKGRSSAGACGLMQLIPSTASRLARREISCDDLKNDNLSIELAIKYIAENQNSLSASNEENQTAAIFAGYNSGYGTGNCGESGTSMCQSNDCSTAGTKAFECCKNPGGLGESIKYAWNGYGLYKKCKTTAAP